ncbi:hypothetical protein PMM47T1_04084 [Pseudomonas sp. M47T1]|uniref:hypothetical protein n=1 Tax=unclassified Pseudomonas TaxID=196821 RepID=UPI0002607811|nr:hypothetical protein [Pseudomonas sp. M47T1]EIK97659.1 hypothetical protein PMM47T1_04084 [Pseudomonas sp. M47T1]
MLRPITLALLLNPALLVSASEGVIRLNGVITMPTCPIAPVAAGNGLAALTGLQQTGPGCEGTGKVAVVTVETAGQPEDGLAVVVVQVY